MVYYNLGIIFVMFTAYDDIILARLFAEIWGHNYMAKNYTRGQMIRLQSHYLNLYEWRWR